MNEKIEELFEKAANKKFPTCETIIHPSELLEFAELIVKQCCNIIQPYESPHCYVDDMINDITNQFGIE